jgi:hypothetical protein
MTDRANQSTSTGEVGRVVCWWCNGRGWIWAAGPGERYQERCDVCQPTPPQDTP